MSKQQETLRLALEALECALSDDRPYIVQCKEAITAIKEALAQPEQEPFCFHDGRNIVGKEYADHSDVFPLYTTPPHRKPLSDKELRVIENKINPNMRWRSSDEEGITLYPIEYYELVRAIEAAHGIKE